MIILSRGGVNAVTAFKVVVLPEPVPPAIIALQGLTPRPSVQTHKNPARCEDKVLKFIKSIIVKGSFLNFLMVKVAPSAETGGMVALTLEPSGNLASSMGVC